MADVAWKEDQFGNGQSLSLGNIIDVWVGWPMNDNAYVVSVNGKNLKKRFDDLEEAKKVALSFLKGRLAGVLSQIETLEGK